MRFLLRHFVFIPFSTLLGILFGLKSITAMVDASFAFSGQARLTELRGLALHLFKTLDADKVSSGLSRWDPPSGYAFSQCL